MEFEFTHTTMVAYLKFIRKNLSDSVLTSQGSPYFYWFLQTNLIFQGKNELVNEEACGK